MSTGPKTAEGKAVSRQNGLKHGMSGKGVVLPACDLAEVESRVEAFEADMRPCSPIGVILIRRLATLSVQMETCTRHEFARQDHNLRHAADDFDEARIAEAEALLESLSESPKSNLRKLRKSPEGVDCLVDAWTLLRADLARDPKPRWTAGHLERAANLVGLSVDHVRGTRLGALSRGVIGDFLGLGDADGGDLDEPARQEWAKDRLIERIDREIAALEEHRTTLDHETIELDRAEAGERALFDTSRDAALVRRYEANALRNFFKALKEFRQVEEESLARPDPIPTPLPDLEESEPMGSDREAMGSVRRPMDPVRMEAEREARRARWALDLAEDRPEDPPISPDPDPKPPG